MSYFSHEDIVLLYDYLIFFVLCFKTILLKYVCVRVFTSFSEDAHFQIRYPINVLQKDSYYIPFLISIVPKFGPCLNEVIAVQRYCVPGERPTRPRCLPSYPGPARPRTVDRLLTTRFDVQWTLGLWSPINVRQ